MSIQPIDPDKAPAKITLNETYDLMEAIEQLDEISQDLPDMEEKRIMAIHQLHILGSKSVYLVGKLLNEQNEILIDRYTKWLKQKELGNVPSDEKYSQETTVYQWAENRKKFLGFGERQSRNYLNLFRDTDEKIGSQLGTKKNEIIRSAPIPQEIKEEIRKKAVEFNWSYSKVSEETKKIVEKIDKEEERLKIKLPPLSVYNKDKDKVVLEINQKYRDILSDILNDEKNKLQEKIYWKSKKMKPGAL